MIQTLLISNSGKPFLGHCRSEIEKFLSNAKTVGFVSAAAFMSSKDYLEFVRKGLEGAPFDIVHIDLDNHPKKTLEEVDAVLVGGGNTYKLLKSITEFDLLAPLRSRVREGMPYIGWSAGSNLAGPTILTTNDWNVVGLSQFNALGIVPFNINPHYLESDPGMAPHSETRDDRIAEYHRVNSNTVLGIEEQTMVRVDGDELRVIGQGRVRRFERGQKAVDHKNGDTIKISTLSSPA